MHIHLSPAPRHVPLSLKIVNFFNGLSMAGWLVFGFGMIFFWGFSMNADFSFVTFRGPHETVDGTVTKVEETGASQNESVVHANHYEYSVAGARLTGTSYSTGSEVAEGETVTVEYAEDDPARSRIEGMRRALFSPAVALVDILPLVGLILIFFGLRSGMRRNHLLRDGAIAMGTLTSKEATNMTVNKRRVYELRFDFTARDGRKYETVARSNNPSRLEDEEQEPLLYDPNDPTRAYVLDDAPARPELEHNGELRGRTGAAIRAMILPVIVIGGHLAFLLFKLGML